VNLFPYCNNDGSYDKWSELPADGHWELLNIGTGLALNGSTGPRNNGEYNPNDVYVNSYNGDAYHIWK
jgi:hypothetical protein